MQSKVLADSSFINRIMYNLVTNAVQAMPNGGKLTIHALRDPSNNLAIYCQRHYIKDG